MNGRHALATLGTGRRGRVVLFFGPRRILVELGCMGLGRAIWVVEVEQRPSPNFQLRAILELQVEVRQFGDRETEGQDLVFCLELAIASTSCEE